MRSDQPPQITFAQAVTPAISEHGVRKNIFGPVHV